VDVYQRADLFREELLRRDRAAASALVRAYGQAWQRLQTRIEALAKQADAAEANGETVSRFWLFEQDRLKTLSDQVEREINKIAGQADAAIRTEQRMAIDAAAEHAEQLARDMIGDPPPGVTLTWSKLPKGAVEQLVGTLADGSPLKDLLDQLGPAASQAARDALVTGLATGQGVRATARNARAALGGNMARALTITRTETLRSYREASRRTYEANADVLDGWIWHSARGTRTCAFCWALHGRVFPTSERMATHPNCRCAMLPRTKSWADLGFHGIPDGRPPLEDGPTLFSRLPIADQRTILGPAKFDAFKAGRLKLDDLIGFRDDPRWGKVGFERSLGAARMASPGGPPGSGWEPPAQPPTPPSGSSGGGQPLSRDELLKIVRVAEDGIRRDQFETVLVFDQTGQEILRKPGQQYSVPILPAEQQLMHGSTTTHNHPRGWEHPPSDPRHQGNSFSEADVRLAIRAGAAEMRAVTQVWRCSVRPGPGQIWSPSFWSQVVEPAFQQADRDVRNDFMPAVRARRMTLTQAMAEHFHEVWSRVAAQTRIQYDRETP
jgi:SPP1 gp7 family putative phage head morphogenesis protein